MQYMNEYNVDKYYKKIEKLKFMYENQLYEESGISNSFINFEHSSGFIYISMKEFEDVRWNGSDIPSVNFLYYFPNYSVMNLGQFEYYVYWRTQVLEGNIQNCDLTYFFVFIYEILAGLHARNKEEGYKLLVSMYKKFREYNKKVDNYLISWILSYCIINNMYVQKKDELEDYVSKNVERFNTWKQDWKIVNEDYTDCFEAVMRASTYKLDKKSKFYLERRDARIIREVFDSSFVAINECMKQHNLILSEFLIGQKEKVRWRVYESTPWEHALDLYSNNIRYEQSFEFAGEVYEYNSEEKDWYKDAVLKNYYARSCNREFCTYLVKVIENICREKAKYKSKLFPSFKNVHAPLRLSALANSGEIENVVEKVVDTYIEKEGFFFEEIPVVKPKVILKKKIIEKNESTNLLNYRAISEVVEGCDKEYLDYKMNIHTYICQLNAIDKPVIEYFEPNTNITKFKKGMEEYSNLLERITYYDGDYENDGMILYEFLKNKERREFIWLKQISDDSRGFSLWVDLIKKGIIIFPDESTSALVLMHLMGNRDIIQDKEWGLVVLSKLWNHYYPNFQREEVLMWIRDYWITYCPDISYDEFKKLFIYQIDFEGDKPQKAIDEINIEELFQERYLAFFSKNSDYRIDKGPTVSVEGQREILEKCLGKTVIKLKSTFAMHGLNLDDYWKKVDYEISEKRRNPFRRMILLKGTLFNIAKVFQSRNITEFEKVSIEFNRIEKDMKYVFVRKRETYFKSHFFIEIIGKICELYLRDWLGLFANFKVDMEKLCVYFPEIENLYTAGELFEAIRKAVEEVCIRNNIQRSFRSKGSIDYLINTKAGNDIDTYDNKNEFEIEMLYGRTDRSKIEEARQVLYNNQEKLVIEDDEDELKNIKIENESSDNSDIQIGILKLLIDSSAGFEAAKRFAESKGTNIVLEIEKINEKALDEIGDMLIDTDGVDYYIYDEYKDYIKKL